MNVSGLKTKTGSEANYIEDYGLVSGYASTWIREPDAYGDIVRKGAFHDSIEKIKREKRSIPFLFNHQHDNIRSYIGTVTELQEDDHGLFFIAEFDNTEEAQRARELVKTGRINGFSFAYNIFDQGMAYLEDGTKANELRELELLEISLTMYPANRDTSVISVKNMKELLKERTKDNRRKASLLREAERLLRK